jgi:hypothetical protein
MLRLSSQIFQTLCPFLFSQMWLTLLPTRDSVVVVLEPQHVERRINATPQPE